MNARNTIIDFTHVYPIELRDELPNLDVIDVSDIQGTQMYCSDESLELLMERLSGCPPTGIHFIDNGNYHYVTGIFTLKIHRPYTLFLFDHHTDMQLPLIENVLSCGSWARMLLETDPFLKKLVVIGPERQAVQPLSRELRRRVLLIPEIPTADEYAEKVFSRDIPEIPAYISIDKDVLSTYFARTNWDQGTMTLPMMEKSISDIFSHRTVIGADICGECTLLEPASQLAEDLRINRETDEILFHFLLKEMRRE